MEDTDIYDSLLQFGATPAEMYLEDLKTRFNERCLVLRRDNSQPGKYASCVTVKGLYTLKTSNTDVDISPYITGINSSTWCNVILLVGKAADTTVTIKYVSGPSGNAYSSTATYGTATYMAHPHLLSLCITSENYTNNCQLRFTGGVSNTKFSITLLPFYYSIGRVTEDQDAL